MVNETVSTFEIEEAEEFSPAVTKSKGNLPKFYLNILKRRWLIILLLTLSGFVPSFLWARTDPVIYAGSFEMLVEPVTSAEKLTEASTLARTGGNVNEELFSLDYPTILKILKSNTILEEIASQVSRKNPQYPSAYLLQSFREDLTVERAQQGQSRFDQTKVITVRYKHEDPNLVISVLEAISEKYLQYGREDRERNLTAGVRFIEEQLPKIRQRIEKLQNQQKELQTRYQLISPDVKGDALFQRNTESNVEIFAVETQLKELNVLASNLQKDLGLNPAEALIASTLSKDPKRQQLLVDLLAIESQIAQQSAQLTPNHPTVLNLKDQRDNLAGLVSRETARVLRENNIDPSVNPRVFAYQDENRIALIQKLIETQNQIDSLSSRYESLKNNQTQTSSQLAVMPSVIKQYNDLVRQIELDTNILNQLTNQKETLSVEIAQKQIPWQILSPPQIPRDKFGRLEGFAPEPFKKLGFGTGLGLMLGVTVAIALEKRGDMIYEVSDLEYAFGLPILGEIEVEEKKKNENLLSAEEKFFLDSQSIYNKVTPSYVSLSQVYANLHFQIPAKQKHRILITSLHPIDQQAYVAANLTKTGLEMGYPIFLIDANELQPEIAYFFQDHQNARLKDLLLIPSSEIALLNRLGEDEEEQDTFFYLENINSYSNLKDEEKLYLHSDEAQSLIEQFGKYYAFTIYNSSFFLESFDLSLLAQKTDGIVMVVRLKRTPLSQLREAIARIQAYDLNFLGFVVVK